MQGHPIKSIRAEKTIISSWGAYYPSEQHHYQFKGKYPGIIGATGSHFYSISQYQKLRSWTAYTCTPSHHQPGLSKDIIRYLRVCSIPAVQSTSQWPPLKTQTFLWNLGTARWARKRAECRYMSRQVITKRTSWTCPYLFGRCNRTLSAEGTFWCI